MIQVESSSQSEGTVESPEGESTPEIIAKGRARIGKLVAATQPVQRSMNVFTNLVEKLQIRSEHWKNSRMSKNGKNLEQVSWKQSGQVSYKTVVSCLI